MRQPLNNLAPWVVYTENGYSVQINSNGLAADNLTVGMVTFSDGSALTSAGSGLPSVIDAGTY